MENQALAIRRGAYCVAPPEMIPLFRPPRQSVKLMVKELRDTLSGRWWGQGPKVAEFERRFGEKFNFPYSIMVNSGTAALWLAYELAGARGPGTEVIVPVLTCTATCHPLLHLGAQIVFADIRPDTLTADLADVERKITPRTKAIVAVHLGGLVIDREGWLALRKRYGIPIVEDACQALGAKTVGFGDYTCFSFQAVKSLSTGDGGMLCVRNPQDYDRAKRLRWFDIDREEKAARNWQAWDRRGITFDQRRPGYKFHANDIMAAIGLAGLKDFDRNLAHRHMLARIYRQLLRSSKVVDLLAEGDSANWLFMVLAKGDRDELAERLWKQGIETNVGHLRNDIFTVFGGKRQDLPGMNEVEFRYLCLPLNDYVSRADVVRVCEAIEAVND